MLKRIIKGLVINWDLHELEKCPFLLPPVCLFISEDDAKREQEQTIGIDYMPLHINIGTESVNAIEKGPRDITVYAVSYALRASKIPALSIPFDTPSRTNFFRSLKSMHANFQDVIIDEQKGTDTEIPIIDEETDPPLEPPPPPAP